MKLDLCIPEPVQPIIKDYLRLTEQRLVGLIHASYIIRSIALGEFNEHFSDIDFVTVLSRMATPIDLGHLRAIHQSIEKTHPKWKMSGSYIQTSDSGKPGNDLRPYPHFQGGRLRPATHQGINSVTWWELKRRSWTRQPGRIAVLGVLRQYFTFRENTITTKVRVGEYALGCLPQQWHPLIQEAISIRQKKQATRDRSQLGRMIETVRFLQYVIGVCNSNLVS